MKKVVILGCENSHADAFIKCIKEDERYSDVIITGVYSDDINASNKLKEKFNINILPNYDSEVGNVDGVIITARHGDNHLKFAKPYLNDDVVMFIDKPITVKNEDANEFKNALIEKGIKITGGSSLKQDIYVQKLKEEALQNVEGKTIGGFVRAPYQSKNDYGNFYFYSQHLTEMVCEIFGRFPKSVYAKENNGNISVIFNYESFSCSGLFCDNNYRYYALRISEEGEQGYSIPFTSDWFKKEFDEFYILLSGGEQKSSYAEIFSPVYIMNAIVKSLETGKEEYIKYE